MSHELHPAARGLLAARTEQAVRQTAVRAFCHLVDADRCELLQPVDGRLESRASVVFGPEATRTPGPLETHRSILEHAYRHGTAGLIDDLADVRAASSPDCEGDDGPDTEGDGGYRSLLCVPVAEFGLLVAADRDSGAFRTQDRKAVRRLGSLVAAALRRVTGESSRLEAVATVLSHDVGNLVGVANGRLELAMEGDYHEQLDAVAGAHHRILELVDDLVTVLRTGDSVEATEPVDLAVEARRAWSTVDAPEASLSVEHAGQLVADPGSLCQLLDNLFRNAVEHGGPDVDVRVGRREDGDGFYVADDGPGIPPANRDDVFEMGFTTGERRTGFGLAIVERIAEAHGWAVRAGESEQGGARFDVTGVDGVAVTPRRPT